MMHGNQKLTAEQEAARRQAIARVKLTMERAHVYTSDGDAYAYPQGKKICWGVNGGPSGYCIARGIE